MYSQKGEVYGSKLCCGELVNPYDAYEWSFVAVPSQKMAGITKGHKIFGKENDMEKILKAIENKRLLHLMRATAESCANILTGLKSRLRTVCCTVKALPVMLWDLPLLFSLTFRETMESVAKSMTIEQLREFKSAFEKKKKAAFEPVPQLYCKQDKRNNTVENGQFSI